MSCGVDGIRDGAAPSEKGMVPATDDSLGKEGWLGGTRKRVSGWKSKTVETVRPVRETY